MECVEVEVSKAGNVVFEAKGEECVCSSPPH